MSKVLVILFLSLIFLRAKAQILPENITEDMLSGRVNFYGNPDFRKVEARYAKNVHFYLRTETYEALKKMCEAGRKDGIILKIGSAMRNFNAQKRIWEAKWKIRTQFKPAARALNIMKFSAMPGTSRHHWGTDIDINAKTDSYFRSGKGKKEYEWLLAHAAEFGFYRPYTAKGTDRKSGYEEEKWHWSYMPLAVHFQEAYRKKMSCKNIKGFAGAEHAREIDAIRKYVFGISQECLNYGNK